MSFSTVFNDGEIFSNSITHVATDSDEVASAARRVLQAYVSLLHARPLYVKSVTSAGIAMMANLTAQLLSKTTAPSWRSASNYALLGGLVTAPLTHLFQEWLDRALPALVSGPVSSRLWRLVLRTLCDRIIFGAPFLLISLYLLNRLEGRSHAAASRLIVLGFWPMFRANVRFWLPLQTVNVNLVPRIYRVLVANLCAFGWIIILARRRKSEAKKHEPVCDGDRKHD